MPSKTKKAKKEINQATIYKLIRKFKGNHAVECDCLILSRQKVYSLHIRWTG